MSFTATLTLTWSSATAAAPATTGPRRCANTDDALPAPRDPGSQAGHEGRSQRLATKLADAIGGALRQIGLGNTASAAVPSSTPAPTDAASSTTPAATPATSADLSSAVQDFVQTLAEALRGGRHRGHDHGDGDHGHRRHQSHHGMAYGGMAARLDALAASGSGDAVLQAFSQLFAAAGGVPLAAGEARGKLAEFLGAMAQGLRGDAANDAALLTAGGLVNVAA